MAQDKKIDGSSKIVARIIHVFITVGILITLLATNTVLHSHIQSQSFILPAVFISAAIVSLIFYFVVSCMDPGYVKVTDPDVKKISLVVDDSDEEVELYEVRTSNERRISDSSEDGERQSMLQGNGQLNSKSSVSPKFNLEPHQRCGFCGLERPLRARHCRECKHCVRKFDHHCPWVANCVGERNHRWFWMFLTYECSLIVWAIYISTTGYIKSSNSNEWIHNNIFLLLVDIVLVAFLFIAGSLCIIHTYMLFSNHTTWESMSRQRITYLKKIEIENPFNLGLCGNIYVFFCYCKPYNWHPVYEKRVGNHIKQDNFSGSHQNEVDISSEVESDPDKETTHL